MDLFLEDKLNNSLGTENEFEEYMSYLIHYNLYNLDMERYDDTFVKLAQASILISNKSENKNEILSSSPYSLDVKLLIDNLQSIYYSFNVSKLFKEAVNTFKIDKYNKNHEEVLKELKKLFD